VSAPELDDAGQAPRRHDDRLGLRPYRFEVAPIPASAGRVLASLHGVSFALGLEVVPAGLLSIARLPQRRVGRAIRAPRQ
jgi:hypothetical protein